MFFFFRKDNPSARTVRLPLGRLFSHRAVNKDITANDDINTLAFGCLPKNPLVHANFWRISYANLLINDRAAGSVPACVGPTERKDNCSQMKVT